VLAGVIVALVVGELWLFGLGYNPTIAPEDVYPTPPLVEALLQGSQDNEPFRVVGTGLALVPNTSMIFRLEDVRGYDPVASRRYMALVSELSGATRVGHHLLFADASAPLLDFLNVRYAFADVALNGRWIPVQEDDGVTLYANPEAMPRAFIVYSSQLADSPAESLAMTLAPDFDFRTTVVLEGAGDPFRKGMPDRSPQVAITHYVPGEMTVQVEMATAGILVTSDPYVPGWETRVDGQITELLIANHAFRAVAVPQGNHTVTFEYQPLSFRAGMWISGISLVVLLLILLWRLIWRKDSYG
jgi:hypothetical protein